MSKSNDTIVLVDDEYQVRSFLETSLRCLGYEVESTAGGEEALRYLRGGGPASAILLDIVMPQRDGFATLTEIRALNADVPVVMLSGMSDPGHVVRSMKRGATDFLAKPVNHEELSLTLQKVMRARSNADGSQLRSAASPAMFFGSNPQMAELRDVLPRIAQSELSVLIYGETGTGKEVLARQLHALSGRAARPFVKVNCAAVPADLVESELFGYERGAFTGAFRKKLGVFDLADGGTIFLDEIGDMDIRLQAKLLQILQDHEFRRLGGKENVHVDVRVLAATHRNLMEAIERNTFREDLFYRLNGFCFSMPSLRERREDIFAMAAFLSRRYDNTQDTPAALTPALRQILEAYDWPGNVRELENVVRKLIVLQDPDFVAEELRLAGVRRAQARSSSPQLIENVPVSPARLKTSDPTLALEDASRAKNEAETEAILGALRMTRWNRKKAAALLNLDYKAFLYKMKKLSIEGKAAV